MEGGLEILDMFLTLDFQQLSHSQHFRVRRVKIYLIVLKRSMVILADIF